MIYLIGGTGRSGKTTVARRFSIEKSIPFLPLDYLMMGVANGLPELKLNPMDDQFIVGRQLWSVVEPMITAFIEHKVDYIIEGVQLVPRQVHQLVEKFNGQVVTCFIGYAEVNVETRAKDCLTFTRTTDDWTDQQHVIEEIEQFKELSIRVKDECAKYQLNYFDNSHDYKGIVELVLKFLHAQSS